MKKLSELINEYKEKGISIPEGTKVSREILISRLANHHMEHAQRNLPSLEQVLPQLAKDIQDLPEKEREEILRSGQYACGEKRTASEASYISGRKVTDSPQETDARILTFRMN